MSLLTERVEEKLLSIPDGYFNTLAFNTSNLGRLLVRISVSDFMYAIISPFALVDSTINTAALIRAHNDNILITENESFIKILEDSSYVYMASAYASGVGGDETTVLTNVCYWFI